MPRQGPRRPIVAIRLDPQLVARIDEAAAAAGKTRSEVVRDTLTERYDQTTEKKNDDD